MIQNCNDLSHPGRLSDTHQSPADHHVVDKKETMLQDCLCCSGPTSICWKVTPIKGGAANITCNPSLFLQRCEHRVNLSIPTPGKYKFTALLINDVSQLEKQWYLYVYDPGKLVQCHFHGTFYLFDCCFMCYSRIFPFNDSC